VSNDFVNGVIRSSIKYKMPHIPSALSLYYLESIFPYISKDWNIVLGKPHGAQAYYYYFEKFFRQKPKQYLSVIETDFYDFIDYCDVTIGNALGIAIGLSYNNKPTWVNISDAALQTGSTLESIQFIGKNQTDILLTVDYNNIQLTEDFMGLDIIEQEKIFINYGWETLIVFDKADYLAIENFMNKIGPKVILFNTKKGKGVKEMEENPIEWHYKILKDINEITII